MARVNVDYNNKQDISDIFTLTNVVTNESLAFIPSDSEGNFNYRGISKNPIMRNAMQTTQTSGEWSDLEYPWMAIPQEDWTGGRGNLRFTVDKSRFYDSYRSQSAFRSVIYNAPLDYYSTGYRTAETNFPGSVTWHPLLNNSVTVTVTPVADIDARNIYVLIKRRGNPEPVAVELHKTSDTTDTTGDYSATLDDVISKFHKITLEEDFAMTAGAEYTLTISGAGNTTNHWEVGMKTDEPYYRITEADEGYRAKFFTYEQLQFMVRQIPNSNHSEVWMNGVIRRARRATDTTIGTYDSWVIDQWKGARIGLVYGPGIQGQISVWRTIVSNTMTDITIDEPWDVTPETRQYYDESTITDTTFIITDTPIWTKIYTFSANVTDIEVAGDSVYFALGDYTPYKVMTWDFILGSFNFTEERYVIYYPEATTTEVRNAESLCATYLKAVRDQSGLVLWRGRNDARSYQITEDDGTYTVTYGETRQRVIDKSYIIDRRRVQTGLVYDNSYTWTQTTAITGSTGDVFPKASYPKIERDDFIPERITNADYVDYYYPDINFKQYKVEIGTFTSTKNTGVLTVTLQESPDVYNWTDVQSITCTCVGTFYLHAHCRHRFRRIKLSVAGTSPSVNNITITEGDTPNSIFSDAIVLKDNYGKITNLFEYGAEQEKSLYVFQEGMVSSVNKTGETYHLDRINIDELQTTADEWNASAVGTTDVYLLWSWLNGLQRYYNTQLEGKGPDHDEGLPKNMRGRITQILSYPSNFFISIDGGADGYSSIFMFNGSGWHNLYTAANKGERIFDIAFQPIYGDRPDRLWFQIGDDIAWLAMPSKILYALQDPNAEYTHEGVLVSAWITGGMAEVKKLWQSLSIMADNLEENVCWIEADYQLDNDNHPWIPIPTNPYATSPQEEKLLASSEESVNGYRLRYRLRLQTTDMHKTPKVNVVLLKAIGIIDIKYSYGFAFRNIKYKADLMGEYEELEPYEVDVILDRWARELCTLRLNSAYKLFDDKKVFLEAPNASVLNEKSEGYIQQITLTEI